MDRLLSLVSDNVFAEIAVILLLALVLGMAGRALKQPLIVAFIALGIIVGPSALNIVQSTEYIHLLADIGIAILLFVVGLKLDLSLIRTTGKVALFTGMGQVLFTSLIGYAIGMALGFSSIVSLYIAIALTFSSTIIIVKLLSDKREIDSLHGQIAIGFLIVQDIVVVLVMIVLSAIGTGTGQSLLNTSAGILIKGGLMVLAIGLLMRYVLPGVTSFLARTTELLVLFAIAWAVVLAAASDLLGFSREVGAFLAGVSLASTQYREAISGRLVSLRDFLLLFFFIHLGSQLDLSQLGAQVAPALLFSLFVLVGNPLIVMVIMGVMGYRRRTGFLAGLTVAQISEFSLIFAALGLQLGHIGDDTVGLITLVGLITIGLSTYLIIYSYPIYDRLAPMLRIFERKNPYREAKVQQLEQRSLDAIVFGMGRYGGNVMRQLKRDGMQVLGVDFDPQVVNRWARDGYTVVFGDVEDPELAEQLPLKQARYVISTLPDVHGNMALLKCMKAHHFEGRILLTAHQAEHAVRFQEAGADLILLPFSDAAEIVPTRIRELDEGT